MAADRSRTMRYPIINDTHWLSRASFALKAERRRRRLLLPLLAFLAVVALAVDNGYLQVPFIGPSRLSAMRQANAGLAREVEQTRTELAVERATRAELQRQADDLSGQVIRLTRQLEFLNSRGARSEAGTRTNPKE